MAMSSQIRDREGDGDGIGALGLPGTPTGLSCPRRGGVLAEQVGDGDLKLQCRTGHVLRLDTLLDAKAEAVEDALWAAVRALEEKAALARRLAERARQREDSEAANRHARVSRAADRRAGIVRDVLAAHQSGTEPPANEG